MGKKGASRGLCEKDRTDSFQVHGRREKTRIFGWRGGIKRSRKKKRKLQ